VTRSGAAAGCHFPWGASPISAKKAGPHRARRPKLSPLWQCLDAHFDTFLDIYPEAYEHDYGFLCPIIPDKSFQLVRYYGWYSNKMRGQRLKRADAEPVDVPEGEVIDVSAFKPRRIPSKSRPQGDSLSAGQERSEAQWQLARTVLVQRQLEKAG
jgi:hypothetical protein